MLFSFSGNINVELYICTTVSSDKDIYDVFLFLLQQHLLIAILLVNKLRPLEFAELQLTKRVQMNVWNKYKKLLRRRSVRRALQEGRPYYGAPDGKHAHVVVSGQPRGGTVRHSGIVPVSVRPQMLYNTDVALSQKAVTQHSQLFALSARTSQRFCMDPM